MRRRRTALKVVKGLDAFPKVSQDYQKTSARGGTLSIITVFIILILVISEFFYYRGTELKFKYSVDTDMESLLLLTLDMTIAMPCEFLGADIVDLAGESKTVTPEMKMEPALFELTDFQNQIFKAKRELLDRYSQYRSLNDFPIIENINSLVMPNEMTEDLTIKKTSCRIHGAMSVKKLAGNFHITIGRSVAHPMGHAHLNMVVPKDTLNFSHRIDHLSFGPPVPGGINPLDSTLRTTDDRKHMFQYYIRVVPTKFSTLHRTMNTNQYSITERNRTLNHKAGSHGAVGVFFRYEMNAMTIEILEHRRSFVQFLIRLCGIIGGIFATSSMIHLFIGSLTEGALCKVLRREQSHVNHVTQVSTPAKDFNSVSGVNIPSEITDSL